MANQLEDYQITQDGVIYNKFGRVMKQCVSADGYMKVCLSINKQPKTYSVHRLIAMKFIPNPENKPYINHINGIKTDNRIENLEWCTQRENLLHCQNVLNKRAFNEKPINRICEKGSTRYNSISEAAKDGFNKDLIGRCLNGKYKQYKGYKWSYA